MTGNSYAHLALDTQDGMLELVGGSGGGPLGPQFQGVPEPSTLALLVAGAIGLLMYAWRKRK